MQSVSHQPQHLEPPVVQPEEGADPDVIDTRLHRPTKPVEAVQVVALAGRSRMQPGIGLVVIGLLEDLIGANSGLLDRPEAGNVHGRGVDVHPADLAVADPHVVHRPDTLGDEIGVVAGVFAEDQDQPFMSFLLQRLDLGAHLGPVQRSPDDLAVGALERAVSAVVHAIVADVQWGEEHDAITVDIAFELPGGLEDQLSQFGIGRVQQHRGLIHAQRLLRQALGDQVPHAGRVRTTGVDQVVQTVIVDEIGRPIAQRHLRHRAHRAFLRLSQSRSVVFSRCRQLAESPLPVPIALPIAAIRWERQ